MEENEIKEIINLFDFSYKKYYFFNTIFIRILHKNLNLFSYYYLFSNSIEQIWEIVWPFV